MRIWGEVRARLACYRDDFKQPFESGKSFAKTLSSAVFMFFTSIGPAVTFSAYLAHSTRNQYGATEVLLSTALAGILFSLLGGQPLVIVGVTGPVSIFSETLYALLTRFFPETIASIYLPFLFWTCLWAGVFHMGIALLGWCDWLRHVTRFSCEVFGALIGLIYIYTAVIEMVSKPTGVDVGLLTLLLSLGTWLVGWALQQVRTSVLYSKTFRHLVSDYAIPLALCLFTGLYYVPALRQVPIGLLAVPQTFQPSNGRASWWIDPVPAEFPLYLIPMALVPGLILTALIFFDHNVSSLLAQQARFRLKKPSAYNWDFLIVGMTMILTGALGLPPTHGLIPQAPLHTESLAFKSEETIVDPLHPDSATKRECVDRVLEQRVSNLLQSCLTALFLLPFGLHLLASIPIAVLNGLFLLMGVDALTASNQFTARLYLLGCVTDTRNRLVAAPHLWPQISGIALRTWAVFTGIQLVFLVLIFGITLTPAAIAFPLCILLLVPTRMFLLPKWFGADVVQMLDGESMEVQDPIEPLEKVSISETVELTEI